jgi:hypothetical protein
VTSALLVFISVAAATPRIAVMDVAPRGGVSADIATTISDALVLEVRKRSPGVSVVGAEEIRSMMGLAAEKQKLGCQEVSCLAEIGGALGAERMVTGTLGRLGETYLLGVQLIDVAHARVVRSGSATVSAKQDDLLFGAVASAVGQIFDGSPPPPPVQPAASVAAPAAAPAVSPAVSSGGCPADRLFSEEQAYAAGGMPTGVGVGDFNGDGKPDLVLANYRSGSVQLFLNRGNGIFRAAVSFPLPKGSNPQDLAVADFNRDGHPDVAAVTQDEDRIDVLLGNGKGGFEPAVSYRVSGPQEYVRPRGLVAGDFDGDGKLDLATVDSNGVSGTASVLFGDGKGHFGPGMHVPAADGQAHVFELAAGDLDGDGRDDLVVLQDPGSASVMLGQKGRKFSAPMPVATGETPRAAAIADMDGDGKKDLVVGNCGDNSVSVLQGLGDGTFAPPHRYSTQLNGVGVCPLAVAVADFDGDGKLDIAVANGGTVTPEAGGRPAVFDHTLTILLAQPGGGYKATRLLTVGKGQPAYLATGHLQGPKGPSDLAASFWGPFNVDGPASLSVFLSGCR